MAYGKLEHLNLSNCNLTDRHGQQLSQVITANESLRVLFIRFYRFLGWGSTLLAKSIAPHKSLQIFDISHNAITSRGRPLVDPVLQYPSCAKKYAKELREETEKAKLAKQKPQKLERKEP